MIFELAKDFAAALAAMPEDHPKRRILRLLEEAIRRDIHFIARHPTTLFQCLWNTCWWYDCPNAAYHYSPPRAGWAQGGAPWEGRGPKLCGLLAAWHRVKAELIPGFRWLRSLRPPRVHLDGRQEIVLRRHKGPVEGLAYSPDGRRIISGSQDGTVRVWDAETGAELQCLKGHDGQVHSVAYRADGQRVASGSEDRTARIWDVESGTEMQCLRGNWGPVLSVAFSPDGRLLALGCGDHTVRIFDADRCCELRCFTGHGRSETGESDYHLPDRGVRSVAFSPDGRRIASGSSDGTARVWDTRSGTELRCLRGHPHWVRCVAFSPDGRRIMTGDGLGDNSIRIWDAESGTELLRLCGHQDSLNGLAYSPDGRSIVSGSFDKTARLWDAASGSELCLLSGHDEAVRSVVFSPGGDRVISGSGFTLGGGDNTVRIWFVGSAADVHTLREDEQGALWVQYSPDGKSIVTGSWDGTIRIWDAQAGKVIRTLATEKKTLAGLRYAADGRRIEARFWDNSMREWDVRTGKCVAGRKPEGLSFEQAFAALYPTPLRGEETALGPPGLEIAWFPVGFSQMVGHPGGRRWAGTAGDHLYIITLEGAMGDET